MSVLNDFQAMPNRVRTLAMIVGTEGSLAKDELARRLVPSVESLGQFDGLLRECDGLGIVVNDKDTNKIRLGDGLSIRRIRDRDQFIAVCLDRLIPNDPDRNARNEGFSRALAWFLTRPIGPSLQAGGEYKSELRRDLEGDEDYELTGAGRCSMFMYWAQALGFAEWLAFKKKDYCIPDPTRAMSAALKTMLKRRSQTPVASFFEKLGNELPVFEMGYIRTEVESRLKKQRDPRYISQSSSLALARLELRGAIKIDQLADAPTKLMLGFDGKERAVSHITLLKG